MGRLRLESTHRVLCGDSTKRECVDRLLGGQIADAFVSDPPYGVDYVGKTKNALPVHNDGAAELGGILDAAFALALANTREGGAWYVCAPAGPQTVEFATRLHANGVWRQTIVWVKDTLVLGHSDYHYKHEVVYYGWKPGAAHEPTPDRNQTSVWEFPKPSRSAEHPTMKPIALIARMIENSVPAGRLILDLFLGSGTTLLAADQLGRRCFGIEFSPQYVDVIVTRWKASKNAGDAVRLTTSGLAEKS